MTKHGNPPAIPLPADLTRRGQPVGSGILGGFVCLAILPPEIAEGHHKTLKAKALRAAMGGARIGGALSGSNFAAHGE